MTFTYVLIIHSVFLAFERVVLGCEKQVAYIVHPLNVNKTQFLCIIHVLGMCMRAAKKHTIVLVSDPNT